MGNILVNNFDAIERLMDECSLDDFYYINILKRAKDNYDIKGDPALFRGLLEIEHLRVKSFDDVLKMKDDIITKCENNNARAYMTLFRSSESEIKQRAIDNPEYNFFALCYPKKEDWAMGNLKSLIDIDFDENYVQNGYNVTDEVEKKLKQFGLTPLYEYKTPSGGKHIIFPDRTDIRISDFLDSCEKTFGDRELIHTIKYPHIILYANIIKKH